jgi:ATP-dependent RNA helicase SUPV3L1/SUV3
LKPQIAVLADEHLSQADREKVQARLDTWIGELVAERLKPLADLAKAEDISGLARGIAFRLQESLGVLKREAVSDEIKSLDQPARSQLRKYGVRFGAFNIYFPALLKPAAADLALALWTLKHAAAHGLDAGDPPVPPRAGLTSLAADPAIPEAYYRAYGYHLCGPRVVRLDMLERLADVIRPLLSWRSNPDASATPPKGSTGDGGFTATAEMMSFLGCSPEELGNVLKALGFKLERRPVKPAAPVAEPAPLSPAEGEVTPEISPGMPAGVMAAEASPAAVVPEPLFEDIWRPRRLRHGDHGEGRGRHRSRGHRESAAGAMPQPAGTSEAVGGMSSGEAGAAHKPAHRHHERKDRAGGESRHERHRHHGKGYHGKSQGAERRGQERRAGASVMSAAPGKKGGVDPDSPFASLGALREALEKRQKEKSSS